MSFWLCWAFALHVVDGIYKVTSLKLLGIHDCTYLEKWLVITWRFFMVQLVCIAKIRCFNTCDSKPLLDYTLTSARCAMQMHCPTNYHSRYFWKEVYILMYYVCHLLCFGNRKKFWMIVHSKIFTLFRVSWQYTFDLVSKQWKRRLGGSWEPCSQIQLLQIRISAESWKSYRWY